MKLRFSDGMTIDTSGELRPLQLTDGWYVVGEGISIACKDQADAYDVLASLITRDLMFKSKGEQQ